MTAKQLTDSILQMAIQGKLVPQDPNDEPASVLLERIREEKKKLVKKKVLKKKDIVEIPINESDKPYNLPDGWEWVRLLNISKSVVDGDHMPPPKSLSGVPFMVISNLQEDGLDFSSTMYVPNDYYNRLSDSRKAEVGDILFSVTGSYGKVVLIKTDVNFCFQRHMALIKPFVLSSYLLYALRSPYVRLVCDDKATGMAQKTVGIDTLRKLLIPLPPIEEQNRIVERIEEYLPIIKEYGEAYDEASKMDAELPDKLKKSILQEAIMGKLGTHDPSDEPASILLNKIREEKKKLVKEKVLKKKDLEEMPIEENEKPFDIPEGWLCLHLGELTHNHGQKKPDSDFSYIDIGSIENKHQKLNDNENILSSKEAPSRARKIVKRGDIIYATVRPYLHNMCIIDRDFSKEPIASTGFAVLSCIKGVYNKFLFYYLLSPIFDEYANDKDNAKGMAYPAINDAKLYKGVVPLPPLAEQHRIVQKIEELYAEIDKMTINNIKTNINEKEETKKE